MPKIKKKKNQSIHQGKKVEVQQPANLLFYRSPHLIDLKNSAGGKFETASSTSEFKKWLNFRPLRIKLQNFSRGGFWFFRERLRRIWLVTCSYTPRIFQIFRPFFRRLKLSRLNSSKRTASAVKRSSFLFLPQPPAGWWRGLAGFFSAALLLILPFQIFNISQKFDSTKNVVLAEALVAFNHLESGGEFITSFQLVAASREFTKASATFREAQDNLASLGHLIRGFIKVVPQQGKTLTSAESLLEAGENISLAANYLTQGFESLHHNQISSLSLTTQIAELKTKLILAVAHLTKTKEHLAKVALAKIPVNYQAALRTTQEALPQAEESLNHFIKFTNLALELLGHYQPRRYLILLQNNQELRPTGGFIGSYALVDIDEGEIKNLEIPSGGSYDLQGSLLTKVISPEPLHVVNPHWEFQDANWFFDFPTSAQKAIWFYEAAGGPTVDGVIALNATLIQELIEITGPLEMPNYNKVITAENFIYETQMAVEVEYDRSENKPKQFIADLTPEILGKVLVNSQQDPLALLQILAQGFRQKDILIYLNDYLLEKNILAQGLGGEIKNPAPGSDYLAVVHTNILGGKTDGVIKNNIKHQAEVLADGQIIDTLTLTRQHQGDPEDIFEGMTNIDYLRVYTPLGSKLLQAEGFSPPPYRLFKNPQEGYTLDWDLLKIEGEERYDAASGTRTTEEFRKTVFANWLAVAPGETKTITLRYELPFRFSSFQSDQTSAKLHFSLKIFDYLKDLLNSESELASYSLLIQKQSGVKQTSFSSRLQFPKTITKIWQVPSELIQEDRNFIFQTELDADKFYGVIFTQD